MLICKPDLDKDLNWQVVSDLTVHIGFSKTDSYHLYHSEWSNSASVGAVAKPKPLPPKALVPSVRSVKSSSTDSTSASSDSSQRETSCRRPNLGEETQQGLLTGSHQSLNTLNF